MRLHRRVNRRAQAWLLIAYSLSILAMYGMDRGVWRHVVMSVAATVLVIVIALLLRARFRTERMCTAGGDPEKS